MAGAVVGLGVLCPCPHLSIRSNHGKIIRKAYEDVVIVAIRKFAPHRDAAIHTEINIAVIGAGRLLQEVCWLNKLFAGKSPGIINLDLVDTDYEKEYMPPIQEFIANVKTRGVTLNVKYWTSCEQLSATKKVYHLVIGMDTEHATPDAVKYQWRALEQGNFGIALLVRWKLSKVHDCYFKVYCRKGMQEPSKVKFSYNCMAVGEYLIPIIDSKLSEAAQDTAAYIKTAMHTR